METLSREIGVRTAELELLRTKKAQETRLVDVQLETTRRELQIKMDELNSAKVSFQWCIYQLHSILKFLDGVIFSILFCRKNCLPFVGRGIASLKSCNLLDSLLQTTQ